MEREIIEKINICLSFSGKLNVKVFSVLIATCKGLGIKRWSGLEEEEELVVNGKKQVNTIPVSTADVAPYLNILFFNCAMS